MDRKEFVKTASQAIAGVTFMDGKERMEPLIKPEEYYFKEDGVIPNNRLPLLVYRQAFDQRGDKGATWLEARFKSNDWYNSWRWGIYPFHHYHSNTHEVLGVFQGSAEVQMGGAAGKKMKIEAGDILIIPAGTGHQCLSYSRDFQVVGAYPEGVEPDLVREEKSKYAASKARIEKVKVPSADPFSGNAEGLVQIWSSVK